MVNFKHRVFTGTSNKESTLYIFTNGIRSETRVVKRLLYSKSGQMWRYFLYDKNRGIMSTISTRCLSDPLSMVQSTTTRPPPRPSARPTEVTHGPGRWDVTTRATLTSYDLTELDPFRLLTTSSFSLVCIKNRMDRGFTNLKTYVQKTYVQSRNIDVFSEVATK